MSIGNDDDVLQALELPPEQYRTEGGTINRGKLRAAILHPAEYLPEGHWLRAVAPAAKSLPPSEAAALVAAGNAAKALRGAIAAYEQAGYGSHVTDPIRDALKNVEWSIREARS